MQLVLDIGVAGGVEVMVVRRHGFLATTLLHVLNELTSSSMICGTHSLPTSLKKLSVNHLCDRVGSTPLSSGILGGSLLSQLSPSSSSSLSTRDVKSMSGFSAV
jgi:hypothetical protein